MSSGRLIVPIAEPILLASGEPDSGATMTVKIAGGPTLAGLFSDPALTDGIPNPQTSDAAGRFYAAATTWWVDASQAYDITINLTDGSTLTFDQQYVLGAATNNQGFAPLNSPAFTGTPTAPTPALNDSTQKLATTAYVQGQGNAPLNSPAFTGAPTAPTVPAGTNTTQLATTAFVAAALGLRLPVSNTSDYVVIGGFYIQWTTFSLGGAGGATQAITWPTPFPTAVVHTPVITVDGAALEQIGVTGASTTGATVQKGATDTFARAGMIYGFGW